MKKAEEEKIVITLNKSEILTDLFDHGGDATDYDEPDSVTEIEIKSK